MSEHDDAGYSADFTNVDTAKAVICDRETCETKIFPPGTDMFYLHSNEPDKRGRHVCEKCYRYYRQKTTTKRRGTYISISF